MKQSKFLKIFGGVFLGVGLLLGGIGAKLVSSTSSFLSEASESQGKVTSLDRRRSRDSNGRSNTSYYPVVEFTTQAGEKIVFSSSVGSRPPSHSVGELVDVMYSTSNPQDAKINSFFSLWGGSLILSFMGLVFGGVGGSLLFFTIKKERAIARVKKFGHAVRAEITGINYDLSFKVNGRSPWVVSCQWHNSTTDKVHTFSSQQYWFDPSQFLEIGQLVDVKYDSKNSKVHWVDLDDVFPEAA